MAFTKKPYCTLDDVKAIADRRSTTDDDLLTQLISRAQATIDAELGFSFQTDGTLAAPAERIFDGNGHTQLLVKPCLSLASVKVRSYSVVSNGSGGLTRTQSDSDITEDVFLAPTNVSPGFILERYTGDSFDLGRRNIVVTGVWGYDTIPDTIKRATERLAVHYLAQRDARYQDVTGNDQYGQLVFKQQLPKDVCELVRRARGGFPVRG